MKKFGNVNIYIDDEEIIDVLKDLPPSEEFDNMNILKFMQEKTKKSDFGGVIFYNKIAYTIYKFDKELIAPEDAGLLMTSSDTKYAIEQLNIWNNFKSTGMSFSEKVFSYISSGLISGKAANIFYDGNK